MLSPCELEGEHCRLGVPARCPLAVPTRAHGSQCPSHCLVCPELCHCLLCDSMVEPSTFWNTKEVWTHRWVMGQRSLWSEALFAPVYQNVVILGSSVTCGVGLLSLSSSRLAQSLETPTVTTLSLFHFQAGMQVWHQLSSVPRCDWLLIWLLVHVRAVRDISYISLLPVSGVTSVWLPSPLQPCGMCAWLWESLGLLGAPQRSGVWDVSLDS